MIDYKKSKAASTTITRDVRELSNMTQNVYKLVAVAGRRANQIGSELKEELNRKLEEFANYTDNLEEIFENREQIEISKFYERLPKPTLLALEEVENDDLYFSDEEKDN